MYNAIIVDDDAIIRKGLKNILDWDSLGFVIAGEAKDGVEGLKMVQELEPDLILTDIKMPNLDGLELISEIRKFNKQIRIIIITAFRNFEFAKKALKYDVFDLLLKPTKIDELIHTVRLSHDYLLDQEKRDEDLKYQEKLFKENIPLLKEKFLHDFIFGIEIPDGTESERLALFDIDLSQFYILIIRFTGKEELTRYNLYLRQIGISKLCEEVFSYDFKVQKIQFRTIQSAFLLIPGNTKEKNYLQELRNLSEELILIVQNSINLEISIGLSSLGETLSQLSGCYKEATLALEKVFFTGSQVVFEYKDEGETTQKDMSQQVTTTDVEVLLMVVQVGNSERVEDWFCLFIQESTANQITIKEARNVCGEIFWKLININSLIEISTIETLDILKTIYDSNSFLEITQIIQKVALKIATRINEIEKESLSELVKKTKNIINETYKEQLTLVSLSEKVFISSSYLSRIFKKEEGITFNEYLTKVRIDKAIELLKNTNLKSYQVAESVGIHDPHYFSRIFKKITGESPSRYRPMRKVQNYECFK